MEQPVTVRSLVSHASVAIALRALGSLRLCSTQPIGILVHDDGTLDCEDFSRLAQGLNHPVILRKSDADEIVFERLAKYPRCSQFRRTNVLAPKLFDLPLFEHSECFAYCDTDVFFYRKVKNLFSLPQQKTGALFMSDSQSAFSLRPWHLVGDAQVHVPARLNTGLMYVRKKILDLDFLEWFFKKDFDVFRRLPLWLEQTCWAALGARAECRFWDPARIKVIETQNCVAKDLVAGHFTSGVRSLFPESLDAFDHTRPPETVATITAPPLGAFALAFAQGRRVLQTRLGI